MKPLCALLVLLVSASAGAQTVSLVVDRALFPQLGNDVLVPANLDDQIVTREWIQSRISPSGVMELRGVALRSSLCLGSWFNPFSQVAPLPGDLLLFGFMSTAGPNGVMRYIVFGTRGYYEIAIGYGCGGAPDLPPENPPPSPTGVPE